MSRQTWVECLFAATADGTPVDNTTTEEIIFPDVTIPANYMADGRVLRLTAYGKLSTTGTPTIIFALRWGGVAGTLMATTEAITNGSGVTNAAWGLNALLQTRTNGATGTVMAMGDVTVNTSSSASVRQVFGVSGWDAPAAATVSWTADTLLSVTADWSAASASNTLTGLVYTIEAMN